MRGKIPGSYDILIRSVGQGIREIHGSASWQDVRPRAEALWAHYAITTGLAWGEVADRVYEAWLETSAAQD